MELQGKVAIITGGGTGIGKATAMLFAAEGAKVVIAGRREQPLQSTVQEIKGKGGEAVYVVTDITDSSQVRRLFARTEELYGQIDILYNNSGVFIRGKEAHEYSEEEWDHILSINLKGTMLCSKYVVPYMKKIGRGVILNNTSVSGRVAQKMQTPYNVSKAALEMMSKCMALELVKDNIRVNTICPNMTETDMTADRIAALGLKTDTDPLVLERLGKPEDIAQAALYLASDRAAWVTGNSLFVDGGYSCR